MASPKSYLNSPQPLALYNAANQEEDVADNKQFWGIWFEEPACDLKSYPS